MNQSTTAEQAHGFGENVSKSIIDLMFFDAIILIKTIGYYLYLTVIITIVSLLALAIVVFAGLVVGLLLGKTLGILAGLLIFSIVLFGPFANWMRVIKCAAKKEFFCKAD